MAKPGQFNMMAVLRVDQDSDMEMLLSLQEDVSRLTRKSWRSRAIFVNVVSSHSRSDRSTQHSDELMEEWLQVAQMLSQAKQPVVGIALHPVYLPGILVLDACDFVIATTDHKGTHIDRVFAEDQLNDYVHLLLHEVAGSSRSMLKRQKRHLVQQKILARLPTASTPDLTMSQFSSSGDLLPLSAPHSASTRASVSSENGVDTGSQFGSHLDEERSSCSFTACPSRFDG